MNNKKREKEHNDYTAYWLQLCEKYFEATTSNEEELALKRFLSTEESNVPEFNEIKAVIGYTETARQVLSTRKRGKKRTTHLARYTSIAAAIALVATIGITAMMQKQTTVENADTESCKDIYIAYIDGVCYTDKDIVIEQMQQAMSKVNCKATDNCIESEMQAMFRISH